MRLQKVQRQQLLMGEEDKRSGKTRIKRRAADDSELRTQRRSTSGAPDDLLRITKFAQ